MKLTIDEALQQGMAAHIEGKLQDAERLYRAILQSQPTQPDANHNLGLLAVTEDKADAALPLFKTALKANPKKEQFWFSYIDALIKEKKFEAAKQVIKQVKTKGMAADKLTAFEMQLVATIKVSESQTAPQKKKLNTSISPSDIELNNLLLAYQNRQFDEVEAVAVSLTERFPRHPFSWKILGALFGQSGRKSEAIKANQTAAELSPQDAEAHYNFGVTLQQSGRLEEAEASYKQALALKPDNAEAHSNLGVTLQELGRLKDAEASYKQAISLKPDYAEAHNNLGNTLKELGKLAEAEASYTQAIALKSNYAKAYSNLGVTLQELGRLKDAEASYTQAIALKSDYAEAHSNLGNTLKELGRLDEAKASYTQAIALKPDYADAHSNLGVTLKELGRSTEAEASYTQAIALKPDYADAHYNLGNTLKELGRLDEAEASYTQAIALKPDFADAHSNLGSTFQELGRLPEAEASYTQAIALKPDFADAYSNLGITLQELGRLPEAVASYAQVVALKPDYAEAHYKLGFTLKELGRLDEAKISYTQAIALKPDFAEAKHMLAALSGKTTATAPRDYVEEVFDNYAAKFEHSLVQNLEYKIPRVVAEMIIKDSKFKLLGSIVDLGCGTGLFGMEIKKVCEYLEGVDLSEKMLTKAKQKNAYNKLIKRDITEYLSKASLNFDYFVSTDVFVYIGDMSDVFRLIKSRNKTGGKLVFSTEDYDGDGFFLEQSGRYSHSKKYIESLCEKFGYKLRQFETQNLRKDRGQYISGGLYLLEF